MPTQAIVLYRTERLPSGKWLCAAKCNCGVEFIAREDNIRTGHTTRCKGCASRSLSERNHIHGMSGSYLHRIWKWMRKRCNNPSYLMYKNYGGRGIRVEKRWDSFQNFYNDMAPTYQAGLQLERVNNDGPYSAENCRWATTKEQQRNKRSNRIIETNLGPMLICEAAEISGLRPETIASRLKRGCPVERLLAASRRRSR